MLKIFYVQNVLRKYLVQKKLITGHIERENWKYMSPQPVPRTERLASEQLAGVFRKAIPYSIPTFFSKKSPYFQEIIFQLSRLKPNKIFQARILIIIQNHKPEIRIPITNHESSILEFS